MKTPGTASTARMWAIVRCESASVCMISMSKKPSKKWRTRRTMRFAVRRSRMPGGLMPP